MNRPTVHDIAKEAGVSLATVDRVLNARPGVHRRTIAKVQDTVRRIGYVRDTYAANLARRRLYNFAFVLPEGPNQFADSLRASLEEASLAAITDRISLTVVKVPQNDPYRIVQSLKALRAKQLDGVALMVPETPQVRDAIMRLKSNGTVIVALVSDLPNSGRQHFIGTCSVASGRAAAQLMGRFAGGLGEVVVVTNSMRSRHSLERRLGFDAVMAADFPGMTVLPSIESYDDPARMDAIVNRAAESCRNLAGVYSMGSGNTAMLNALRRSGRLGRLTVLAHELTPATRIALTRNEISAVIAQNVGHVVRSAIRVLRNLSDDLPIFEDQERVRIEIVMKDNLP